MPSEPKAVSKAKEKASTGGKYGLSRTRDSHLLDVYQVDGELLRDAIAHVVLEGDAILFGMTRDQTALKVQLLTEGGSEELYVGTTESLEDALRIVRDVQG